jgi:hypothetical protein
MRSPRPVSTGLAYEVASLPTCGGVASSSHRVSPVEARRDASRVHIRVQATSPRSNQPNSQGLREKAATRLIARKDHAATPGRSVTALITEHVRVTALLLTLARPNLCGGTEGQRDRELEKAGTPGTPVPARCPSKSRASSQVRWNSGTTGTAGTVASRSRQPHSSTSPGLKRA